MCHLAEVFAALDAFDSCQGDLARLLALLRRGAIGCFDQDVVEVYRGAAIGTATAFKVAVDFRLGDLDTVGDLAITQAAHDDFVTHRVAERIEVDAFRLQCLLQFGDRQLVVGGDCVDGARDGLFVGLDTEAVRFGQLQLVHHQGVEGLFLDCRIGRHRRNIFGFKPLFHLGRFDAQLAEHHHVVADHGENAVDQQGLFGSRRRLCQQQAQASCGQ